MKALSHDEQWALDLLAAGPATYDAHTPEGAKLDALMVTLIERGCVAWERWPNNQGTSFALTDLGHLARRVARAAALPSTT